MASFKAFLNSPVVPKTTHFWGPVANWGFVLAPRNYLLLVCHASNESVQLYQLSRWAKGQGYLGEEKRRKKQFNLREWILCISVYFFGMMKSNPRALSFKSMNRTAPVGAPNSYRSS